MTSTECVSLLCSCSIVCISLSRVAYPSRESA